MLKWQYMSHYLNPLIPANTGNIARTCAGTGTKLHLIKPLGFSTDDKMLKRAGLDYWQYVDISYHDGIHELFDTYPEAQFYFITKFGKKPYSAFDFSETLRIYSLFLVKRRQGFLMKSLKRTKSAACAFR